MTVLHASSRLRGRDRWLLAGVVLVTLALTGAAAWESFVPAPPAPGAEPLALGIRNATEAPGGRPPAAPRHLFRIQVTVTGYSSTPDQTDATPFLTASNTRTRRGVIALSRDLLREYTPGAPFAFGDLVELEGVGIFRVEDTMARRFRRRADIWFSSRTAAIRWGRRQLVASKISWPAEKQEQRRAEREPVPLFQAALAD